MADEKEVLTASDLTGQAAPVDNKPPRKKTPAELEIENERLKAKLWEMEGAHKKDMAINREIIEEKRKPGIAQYDEEDRKMKKKDARNPWGLTDLVLPPYTKGRVAVYQIINHEEVNPATNMPVESVPVMMPGRYTFFDRFEKTATAMNKIITNITGSKAKAGSTENEDTIEDIIFERGKLYVDIGKQYNLYVVMELHPNNKNNKFRPTNVPARFERIDINYKSKASLDATLDLGLQAVDEIKEMDKTQILQYATAVEDIISSAGRPIHEMRSDLKRWALNNPEKFYRMIPNNKAAIQLHILDAVTFGVIQYRVNEKGFCMVETDEVICSHTPSQDPMEQLVKFLSSKDGDKWYQAILKSMQYWED
jgi:hypothetical protein